MTGRTGIPEDPLYIHSYYRESSNSSNTPFVFRDSTAFHYVLSGNAPDTWYVHLQGSQAPFDPAAVPQVAADPYTDPNLDTGHVTAFRSWDDAGIVIADITKAYPNTQDTITWADDQSVESAERIFGILGSGGDDGYFFLLDRILTTASGDTVGTILHLTTADDDSLPVLFHNDPDSTVDTWTTVSGITTSDGDNNGWTGYWMEKGDSKLWSFVAYPATATLTITGIGGESANPAPAWNEGRRGTIASPTDDTYESWEFWHTRGATAYNYAYDNNLSHTLTNYTGTGDAQGWAGGFRIEMEKAVSGSRDFVCLQMFHVRDSIATEHAVMAADTDDGPYQLGSGWVGAMVDMGDTTGAVAFSGTPGTTMEALSLVAQTSDPVVLVVADLVPGTYVIAKSGATETTTVAADGILKTNLAAGGTFYIYRSDTGVYWTVPNLRSGAVYEFWILNSPTVGPCDIPTSDVIMIRHPSAGTASAGNADYIFLPLQDEATDTAVEYKIEMLHGGAGISKYVAEVWDGSTAEVPPIRTDGPNAGTGYYTWTLPANQGNDTTGYDVTAQVAPVNIQNTAGCGLTYTVTDLDILADQAEGTQISIPLRAGEWEYRISVLDEAGNRALYTSEIYTYVP
jgi:hypothetical protein